LENIIIREKKGTSVSKEQSRIFKRNGRRTWDKNMVFFLEVIDKGVSDLGVKIIQKKKAREKKIDPFCRPSKRRGRIHSEILKAKWKRREKWLFEDEPGGCQEEIQMALTQFFELVSKKFRKIISERYLPLVETVLLSRKFICFCIWEMVFKYVMA
jgi:hypothetical protein